MKLAHFSYLIKVPLALCLVSFASAVGVFAVTYYLLSSYVSVELMTRMQQISNSVAQSSKLTIQRDEIWDLHQQIQSVVKADTGTTILILDSIGQIIVASDTHTYPVMSDSSMVPASVKDLVLLSLKEQNFTAKITMQPDDGNVFFASATAVLADDGEPLGSVVVYSKQDSVIPKFRDLLAKVISYGGIALCFIIPLGWWLGRRLVEPLKMLKNSMLSISKQNHSLDQQLISIANGTDEISQLAAQFIAMNAELDRIKDLENQIQAAERMALTGRLASALAHEVNNPLGGMMNIIANLRLRGISDPHIEKTTNLLDRGLKQISESINALMSQARKEQTLLSTSDIEDLKTLSTSVADKQKIKINWTSTINKEEIQIRAIPVRQIILNLLLNAIHAAEEVVSVQIHLKNNRLLCLVFNDGPGFSAEFEELPKSSTNGRTGLGLWVSFRLTDQLGGMLNIAPNEYPSGTLAELSIPIGEPHAKNSSD
jgi:signal transduction histidine kinase